MISYEKGNPQKAQSFTNKERRRFTSRKLLILPSTAKNLCMQGARIKWSLRWHSVKNKYDFIKHVTTRAREWEHPCKIYGALVWGDQISKLSNQISVQKPTPVMVDSSRAMARQALLPCNSMASSWACLLSSHALDWKYMPHYESQNMTTDTSDCWATEVKQEWDRKHPLLLSSSWGDATQ